MLVSYSFPFILSEPVAGQEPQSAVSASHSVPTQAFVSSSWQTRPGNWSSWETFFTREEEVVFFFIQL